MLRPLLVCVLLAGFTSGTLAQSTMEAVTDDGRRVHLKSDKTWSFVEVEQGDPAKSAVLTVLKVREMQDACGLNLHLQNNLGFKISSLVPRLGVYNQEGVLFDSKSVSFASIKPTKHAFTKIQFSGIGCHEITRITVYDAARCRMGDIDQWNEEEGQCLGYIYVEPSDKIEISK